MARCTAKNNKVLCCVRGTEQNKAMKESEKCSPITIIKENMVAAATRWGFSHAQRLILKKFHFWRMHRPWRLWVSSDTSHNKEGSGVRFTSLQSRLALSCETWGHREPHTQGPPAAVNALNQCHSGGAVGTSLHCHHFHIRPLSPPWLLQLLATRFAPPLPPTMLMLASLHQGPPKLYPAEGPKNFWAGPAGLFWHYILPPKQNRDWEESKINVEFHANWM